MINVVWDSGFKRKYKKLSKNNRVFNELFWKKIQLFINKPYDSLLKTHKLSGKLEDCWAATFDYDCRIIFQFIDSENILLLDIGSHDEVY